MTVVASDDPMIDADRLRERLDVSVTTATFESAADIVAGASDARALVVDVNTPVPASVITDLPALEIVARAGVGVENIDVGAAADAGVDVTNVPDYCTDEVATRAVALLLSCVRSVPRYDRSVEDGAWDWTVGRPIHRLPGSTLGLVSLGPISRRVAERVQGFGLDLVGYDPYVDADEMRSHGVEKVDFETLLDRADHVVSNAPLTDETRGLFDADAFERMRDHATLVNTGRGGVVDEAALASALETGEIEAAALDVMAEEPPADSPLFDREDAILTPHAGWYSEEARAELNDTVAENIAAALAGETPPDRIDPDLGWV
jgi:D-3-phosphoglycerate dehydrogenase